jgi:hypothetical protein
MSYPFGFDGTFHGFHFRSVVLPVFLVCLAVVIAGAPARASPGGAWSVVLFALTVASAPVLYQFEYSDAFPSPVYWGLVDNFLVGLSALAAAAAVRSVTLESLAWAAVAFAVSAFSLLVKPAGLVTLGLVDAVFFFVAALDRRPRRFLLGAVLLATAIQGATLYAVFRSEYPSAANISFYGGSMALLRSQMAALVTPALLHRMLHTSLGYPLLAALLVAVILVFLPPASPGGERERRFSRSSLLLGASAALAAGAGVVEVLATDLTQIRYALPCFFIGIVLVTPLVLRVDATAPRRARTALRLLWCVPVFAVGSLLCLESPPVAAQRLAGVNLTSDGAADEVRRADRLVDQMRDEGQEAVVYSFYSGSATASFECVAHWRKLLDPALASFRVRLPLDWIHPPAFRLDEMSMARYLLFTPVPDPAERERAVAVEKVATFEQEKALFHALATDLDEAAGVRVEWEGRALRLLVVADGAALRAHFVRALKGRSLRPEFLEANPGFPRPDAENAGLDGGTRPGS